MKKFKLLIIVLVAGFQFTNAQNVFEQCGFDKKPLTLSRGHYDEFFSNNEIVQIGTVLLNTKTNKVAAFVDEENSDSKYLSEHSSRWLSVDPLAAKYPQVSPYAYCVNNPIIFIDPDGQKIKLANNYAGAMTNIAQVAATNLGNQVMSHLIGKNETYTMNSTFLTARSSYNPDNRKINYVANPWYNEVPYDGGALTSMTAMGHEALHAFDHSNFAFIADNADARKSSLEPRSVSFANYLRKAYSLSPSRDKYGSIDGNFHQFSGNEKISDFTTFGNNADETSYGFSYTKTTTTAVSYIEYAWGSVPDKTKTETTTYYMTVNMDKDKNVTYQIYDNEKDYRNATSNW